MNTKALGILLVILLFVGSFQACQKEEPPTAMKILSIEVLRYPPTDGSGNGWDVSSGPDIFASIIRGTGVSSTDRATTTRQNVSGLPFILPLTTPYTISDFNFLYTIALYDEDDLSMDDFVGYVSFFTSEFSEEAPSSFTISEGQTEYRLTVEWVY
jgi:hypothetical protein